MEIVSVKEAIKDQGEKAVAVLKKGGLIIYPTDTCYGLGADATNSGAIDKLMAFKGERKGKPVAVAVSNLVMAEEYVFLSEKARALAKKYLPGPLTLACLSKHKVDPRLESAEGTLGVRIPDTPLLLAIIAALGKPITTTSANISGGASPYSRSSWEKETPQERQALVDLFLDAGELPFSPPSTVVEVSGEKIKIIRQGAIKIKE
ncbi:threonylcarbamoyl-AMP synthase [Candidatus Shapirobacteria bacterium]|nr:threonylcarbamoyl-AMP synthase [Candidatus Shapirobacteria bacterium]